MPTQRPSEPSGPSARWFALFAITRLAAGLVAPLLLLLQGVSGEEAALVAGALVYSVATIVALWRRPRLQRAAAFWVLDAAAVLALIAASGEWRSSFYLLALTSLVLPATTLRPPHALAFGGLFVLGYLGVAIGVGVDWDALATTARLESFSTHLLVPLLVTTALTYSARLLGRLEEEQRLAQRLTLEAERNRIALELHDSAKQRILAAHLVLSAMPAAQADDPIVGLARRELQAATADMDTSLRDLREPLLAEHTLGEALRDWGAQLAASGDTAVDVAGDAPALSPFTAAHAYRLAREAMINAVRHAQAGAVHVRVEARGGRLRLTVADDGVGLPDEIRPGANGLRSMRNRAEALGGELFIGPGADGRGTTVALDAPVVPPARIAS